MGNSMPHYHQDHVAGKGENSVQHYNLVHKFIPMPQAMKIPAAKAAVDKEWEKLEKNSAWNLTKVRSKKEVIDEARTSGATVHFASLMDICHLKNAELEAKHQKYKGRVVLRGDFVKDDSGSYAVFTEQGSSASQMTAAKITDIISRLPGCDGQAADAVSAGQGDGVPKAGLKQAAADSQGSRTCVCANTFPTGWHTQEGKDELTSCRGTVESAWQKPPVRRKGGRAGLPARVSGRHVVRGRQSSPTLEVRLGEQARLVKTVKIQVRWAAAQPGQDRRLPSVATHSRLQRATSVRSRVGIVLEDGSGVAIDWVTGRSYCSARRRLNVQSGQRKGRKVCCGPLPERCRP